MSQIWFAGHEFSSVDCFNHWGATGLGSYGNSYFVRSTIPAYLDLLGAGYRVDLGATKNANSADGVWVKFNFYPESVNGTTTACICRAEDADRNISFELYVKSGTTNYFSSTFIVRLYEYLSTSYTEIEVQVPSLYSQGTAIVSGTNKIYFHCSVCLHVYTQSGNSKLDFYWDGRLCGSAEVTSNSNTGVRYFRVFGVSANQTHYYEMILADHDIRPYRVHTLVPTGDGYHSDPDETYTDIDSYVLKQNFMRLTGAGDRYTYTTAGLPRTDCNIKAVFIGGRFSGNMEKNIFFSTRISSTDYDSSSFPITPTDQGYYAGYANDPSTSSPWSGNLASIQWGFGVSP